MKIADFILNLQDRYKMPTETAELQKITDIIKQDFGFYSESKLEKVWYAVKRYHGSNFAPNYSAIATCMDKAGIGESQNGNDSKFYNLCTELKLTGEKDIDGDDITIECGTKYSLRSKFCPVCNIAATIATPIMNTLKVIKCNVLPGDLRVLNELCGTCSKYHKSSQVRGARCDAWNSHDDYRKSNKNCSECCCFDCCNEKPMNGAQHASLKIVKGVVKGVNNKPEGETNERDRVERVGDWAYTLGFVH